MGETNETHDPSRKSWIETANQDQCPFPIQNLPYGVFNTADSRAKRVGVAIGDQIVDLSAVERAGLVRPKPGDTVFDKESINAFMALRPEVWRNTRRTISDLLSSDNGTLRGNATLYAEALVPTTEATLHLPIEVAEFTDFYASKEHATNVGSMFRDPDNALLPNWLHIPICYNGRASTVVVSGSDVRRPLGQIKPPNADRPIFSACRKLDMELEMGAVVGTPNEMGAPITVAAAEEMIFGYVILNDWSARDIQAWEYVPLGPFQSKAFATSISPWVVTRCALEPFRVRGPEQQPAPLPYLRQNEPNNYDLHLEASLQPQGTGGPTTICRTNFKYMYWSSAQQLAHHAISGCAMRTGDLLGSGTISGPAKESFGSLLELTWNGKNPIPLETGGERVFLEDGDAVTMTGWCQGDGYRIGFGGVCGTIVPASTSCPG
ncbi:MAG: fumarylacetoacetase [Gammaproteobacteria bacterium]